jgi:hypothetical protein
MKRPLILLTSLFLALGPLPWLPCPPAALAKSAFKIPKPPNRGAPGTASAGASRAEVGLTALVPSSAQAVGGYTTLEQPTFWFYNPYGTAPQASLLQSNPQSKLISLKLTLKDDQAQLVDRIVVPIPAQAGLLRVQLAAKLRPDRPYRWSLQAQVKSPNSTVIDMVVVDGWIQRELPTAAMTQALKTATPLDQFQIYRQQGIWFDALTRLAERRANDPKDPALAQAWVNLLSSVNLPKPVIDCSLGTCQPRSQF